MITNTVNFKNFEHFRSEILPIYSNNIQYDNFVFRGEASDKWELLPKALRDSQKEKLIQLSAINFNNALKSGDDLSTELFQFQLEYSVLKQFYVSSDQHGLRVPDSQTINDTYLERVNISLFKKMMAENNYKWLPSDIIEVAALAQHYGLPTRMLDFTFDIFTALYFASYEAFRKFDEDFSSIVIWALDYRTISMNRHGANRIPIEFSVPKYADNPNISAQRGVLVYWETTYNLKNLIEKPLPVDRTPFDKKLEAYADDKQMQKEKPILQKFLLPKTECFSIISFLSSLGYSAARLFPGYNGITRMIDEQSQILKFATEYINDNQI